MSMKVHTVLLQNEAATPLGRFRLAGRFCEGTGIDRVPPLRVYGAYAVMAVLRGEGQYCDANGRCLPLSAGSVVLVLPEHAHWYGPPRGRTWDELYLTFDGPAFDLWRRAGIFDPARSVSAAPKGWADRLEGFIANAASGGSIAQRTRQIVAFQTLLSELLITENDHFAHASGAETSAAWLTLARRMLEEDLGRTLNLAAVAGEAGLSYESFRKKFQKEAGISPLHYRTLRRIDAARELLRYSPQMTNRQVSETLGFTDEFHFSKRFTQIAGITPRDFRRQVFDGES